jgi:3-hydroxyacyl-CoA dehydrogenase
MKEALSDADLVQENGPERPDFKIKLYAEMEEVAPVDSLFASSSSGITPSVIQEMQTPRACGNRTSIQSTAYHPVSRSRRR